MYMSYDYSYFVTALQNDWQQNEGDCLSIVRARHHILFAVDSRFA